MNQSERDQLDCQPLVERVDIRLCIGLIGVCIIGLTGDESEGVFSHIDDIGPEDWYELLPEHDKPIEGIYSIVCDVTYSERSISYSVVSVSI